jgi:hypothetical protein
MSNTSTLIVAQVNPGPAIENPTQFHDLFPTEHLTKNPLTLTLQNFARPISHSTSKACLVPLGPASTLLAYLLPDNLRGTHHFDLVVSSALFTPPGLINIPAMDGSNAATTVVETPCPNVFHFSLSVSTVLPASSMNPTPIRNQLHSNIELAVRKYPWPSSHPWHGGQDWSRSHQGGRRKLATPCSHTAP